MATDAGNLLYVTGAMWIEKAGFGISYYKWKTDWAKSIDAM